ncbi:MAG: TetR/AcrR family transcriptional regulator [Amphiplicatus sp.]
MSQAPAMKPEDKREKLLQAAERCFIESGFHGARMAQIAKQAQMSPGHIYHYFESKEQIIAEMVRAHADEKLCALEKFKDAGDRIVDMMLENIEESVDSNTEPFWSALMLEMTAEATRNAEIASTLRTVDADMKARVINYLGAGVNQENIGARLEVLVALLQGIGIRNILNPDLDKAEVLRLVRGIVETLFREPEPPDHP